MAAPYDYDLVCIGSGPAGQRGAVQAAKIGKRVAVVEKLRCAGGACVDTGTIPSKTLREAVVFFSGLGGRFDRRRGLRAESRPSAPDLLSRVMATVRFMLASTVHSFSSRTARLRSIVLARAMSRRC